MTGMTDSFMQRQLPPRSYGIMMSLDAMKLAAKESPTEKTPHERRIDRLTLNLARCVQVQGEENSGMLRLLAGRLTDSQLTLLEEAILAHNDKQSRHEEFRSLSPNQHHGTFAFYGSDWGPFDHIVSAAMPEFDEIALIAIRDFSILHHNMKDLIRLCKIMNELGIPLTERNIERQIVALIEVTQNRSELVVFSHPYLSFPELIRAVHDYPEHLMEIVDLQRARGNVRAAAEVFGSSKAVSSGAL